MTKVVSEAFDILIERLKHSEVETESAATHRKAIDARLTFDFEMTRMFRSGSYGHGTSLSGISDIDYFAVIPNEKLYANSGATLTKIKDAMQARFFSTSGIHVDSPAVVIPFANGAQRHEIIPACANGTHNGHSVFEIPDRSGGWTNASPSAHNAWVNATNNKHSQKVKQLIRLVKYWNFVRDGGIRSFYLELRTAEYANSEISILYKWDVRGVLRHLSNRSLAAMQDPQGVSGYVHSCSTASKDAALSKVNTALTRADKAMEAEKAGKHQDAFFWWDLVFNGKFPAYY